MHSKKQSILAGAFAAVMALTLVAPALSMLARADDDEDFTKEQNQISGLDNKLDDLKAEQTKIQNELNKVKGEKNKHIAVKQQIGIQIDNTTEQTKLLTERIDLLGQMMAQKQEEMDQKQKEIDANYELFKKRFRAMTKTPQATTLGLVLGAQDYSQFVNRTQVTARVAEYDRELMEDLNRQKQELAKLKAGVEADKEEVEGDKSELDEKKQELDSKLSETQKQIQDIAAEEQIYLANKKEIDAAMAKVQAEMDAIYAELARRQTSATYVGGKMSLPAPTLTQITSPYGSRWGDFHTGIDFSVAGGGAYGQPIRAANAGTVVVANTVVKGSGYSGGYGKYVIVDHGGGITTLYAHASALNVQEGDKVIAGQTIAQVGSTGWSTGPHLHFEVRENGKHTNPTRYLYG